MEIVPIKIEAGEGKAWQEVCGLSRDDVCKRTVAIYDEKAGAYILRCFGIDFEVDPCDMRIACPSAQGTIFLDELKTFFRLTVLCYMASAMDIPVTGRLIRPVDVKGGHRFSAGTHVLPLDAIAARFSKDKEGFIARGRDYGAEIVAGYGDACVRIYPLPRVPITMVLWVEDEEFPAKVDLFFDSTCEFQLSRSDTIWASALMSCVVMAGEGTCAASDHA